MTICIEAPLKGWLVFYTLPGLLFTVPFVFFLRRIAGIQTKRGIAHPWLRPMVDVQLVGVTMFYLCLPGFSDTAMWAVIPMLSISGKLADFLSELALLVLLPSSLLISVIACSLLLLGHINGRSAKA